MAGSDHGSIVLQPRDRRLLSELAGMRVIDREQTKLVAGFTSTTRANVRLLTLYRGGLLRRMFQGTEAGGKKALYTLSPKGSRLLGIAHRGLRHANDELLVTNFFVSHQLAVNEVYCQAKYRGTPHETFTRWLRFEEPIATGIPLVPDGYFEVATPTGVVSSFVEVDMGNEGLPVWTGKVRAYLHFAAAGTFEEKFKQRQFRVLVIATTEARLESIRKTVLKLTGKIFWFATLAEIRQHGLWESIWRRPEDQNPRKFF